MSKTVEYNKHGFENIDIRNPETIRRLEDKLGIEIGGVQEFTVGTFNKVFRLSGEQNDIVIKVSPEWNKKGLNREKWCYEQIRNLTRLHIARLLKYLGCENSVFPGHEILAMDYIPGHTVTHVEMMRRENHQAAAHILSEFHQIKHVDGYGWLNDGFSGENQDWHEFLEEIDNIDVVLDSDILPTQDVDWLIREMLDTVPPNAQTTLLFGDLKKDNLIVTDLPDDCETGDKIVPIDFQNCFVGDPVYDVGIGLFSNPEMLIYLKNYLNGNNFNEDKRKAILYALRHALSTLGHRIMIGNHTGVNQALSRFRRFRTLYQSLL